MADPKEDAFVAAARSMSAPVPTENEKRGWAERLKGCQKQGKSLAMDIQKAVASGDANAVKQKEDLLRENYRLRRELIGKLKAVGMTAEAADPETDSL